MEDEMTALARRLYEAYGNFTDHKNFQGNPMPAWEDLTDKIRGAWKAAAEASQGKIELNDRERAQIRHADAYDEQFADAGAPGHGQFILIAKLARALGIT